MIKRFYKNKPYTLCLIKKTEYDDFNTWCVNVTYTGRIENTLEFRSSESVYTVNLDDRMVIRTYEDLIEDETGEPCYIEMYDFCKYTNIVQGWQY